MSTTFNISLFSLENNASILKLDQNLLDPTNFSIDNSTTISSKPYCINSLPRTPAPGTVPYYVGVYILPWIFAIGILGNILNLIVMNSKGMRTKTNCFLSAMAATDLCFFFMMALFNMSAFDIFATSETFMKVYVEAKMTLMTMANWFSAASIWIAVAVTVERLVAICRPLHARFFWETRRIVVLLACIYIFSFYLFLHNWFWMWPTSVLLCNGNGRRVYGLRKINRDDTPSLYDYVLVSQYLAIACTVLVPVAALMILNSMLLYFLRRNRRDMLAKLVPTDLITSAALAATIGADRKLNNKKKIGSNGSASTINISIRQRTCENKVAFMVSVIIVSFIVFLSPSAFMYIWETIGIMVLKYPRPKWLPMVAFVSNQLVTINKAMNFVLYCSAGKHFRRKLLQLICKRLLVKKRYYESKNHSRSVSRADNYTLNSLPGQVEGTSFSQSGTPSSKRRLARNRTSSALMINIKTDKRSSSDESRFGAYFQKKTSAQGYSRQTSSTPSPQQQNAQQKMTKRSGKKTETEASSPTTAKEVDWLLDEGK